MIPQAVIHWLEANDFGEVTTSRYVGGGCINQGTRLHTTSGDSFFLKTNTSTPPDMFEREAEGLEALNQVGGPRTPRPWLYGPDFILMEDLVPAPRAADYWRVFGRQLATLHNVTQPRFGFDHDNYIGSTPQPNEWTPDGYQFFAEQRLLYQARLAVRQGLMTGKVAAQVEHLSARLPDLVPQQPASLLHGDLWSGNAITDAGGGPAVIDPAAHYGWAEAELAMTALFGSFPEVFYRAYQEVRPLDKGFTERFALYNLYHLLNHLNLFGSGYLGQVMSILHYYQ
ncbi:MAG: fructosamine kinase family protein [Chloroflexota bacterium]